VRIVLVGEPGERARLRAALAGAAVEIVGEAATLAEARDQEADALVLTEQTVASSQRRERVERAAAGARGWGSAHTLDDVDPLTPREIQVLALLGEGLPNKAIAARLEISDQTVKFHVSSICGKLGAANRTEAVRLGVRRGLITL
jgi:DNA-binding NarL/FixJ family response regulator